MNDELLEKVKSVLLIGDYHDEMLKIYIAEVLEYMRCAGVSESTLTSEKIIGAVARGVSDLWCNGILSNYFCQRVIQLTKWGDDDV